MGRPRDPKLGGTVCHAGPHGEAPGSGRGRGSEAEMWARTFIRVSAGRIDEAESEGQRWPIGWLHQAPAPWGRTLIVRYPAGRDQGRGSVAQSVRAP